MDALTECMALVLVFLVSFVIARRIFDGRR